MKIKEIKKNEITCSIQQLDRDRGGRQGLEDVVHPMRRKEGNPEVAAERRGGHRRIVGGEDLRRRRKGHRREETREREKEG